MVSLTNLSIYLLPGFICSTCGFVRLGLSQSPRCPSQLKEKLLFQSNGEGQKKQNKVLLYCWYDYFVLCFLRRRVCVVQLKLKWNSLSWKKKKRWMGCPLMEKRVPFLTADPMVPWDMALMTTRPRCPSTTNHGTMWRPLSVMLKIWKMDSKNMKTHFLNCK